MNWYKVNYVYIFTDHVHIQRNSIPTNTRQKAYLQRDFREPTHPSPPIPHPAFNPWVWVGPMIHNQLNNESSASFQAQTAKAWQLLLLISWTLTWGALNNHVRKPTMPLYLQLFQPPNIWSITGKSPSNMEQRCIIPPVPRIPDPQNHKYANNNKIFLSH